MKNWKYIEGAKVGNETLAAHPDSAVAQEIYKIYLDNGKDKKKALEKLSGKYKNIPSDALEKHLDDAIKAYAQMIKNKSVANEDKTGAEEFFKKLSDDVKEREKKDDKEIKLVGNETYQHKLYPDKYVIIEGNNYKIVTDGKVEKSGKITDAVLYGINQAYKRVGNASVGGGTYASDDGSKKAVVDITNLQSGSTRVVWIEDGRQTGSNEYRSLQSAIDACKRKGLKKVGNSASEYEILKQDPSKMHPMYKKAYEEALKKLSKEDEEFKKRFEREYGVKAKNEKSDDKFAYVMREFDAGKLKTPDGKVVTDPAQAKAIAYSESKKTENGLARARKAMNAWNSERKIEPVGKYREFIDNLKNAIELGVAGVLYNSLDEQTVKEWVEKAKKEGYSSHISGVQGKKVILK